MKSKERIALRLLLFAVRLMIGWSCKDEYQDMLDKINGDIAAAKDDEDN